MSKRSPCAIRGEFANLADPFHRLLPMQVDCPMALLVNLQSNQFQVRGSSMAARLLDDKSRDLEALAYPRQDEEGQACEGSRKMGSYSRAQTEDISSRRYIALVSSTESRLGVE